MYCKNSKKKIAKNKDLPGTSWCRKKRDGYSTDFVFSCIRGLQNEANQAYQPDLSIPDPVNIIQKLLTLKGPITTAADDKFWDIFPNFQQK